MTVIRAIFARRSDSSAVLSVVRKSRSRASLKQDHLIQLSWPGSQRRLGHADYDTLRYINLIALGNCPLV